MHGHIRERKKIPNNVKHLTFQFAMPKHTNVIDIALLLCRSIPVSNYDWRVTMVRWLFMPFSQDFLVLPVKKSDKSVKFKKQLNRTHHKHEP